MSTTTSNSKPVNEFKGIKIGDRVTSNKFYDLDKYFYDGSRKVLRIDENGLKYTGGAFVFVEYAGKEQGFYFNALKKA